MPADPTSRLDALAAAWDDMVAALEGQRWTDSMIRLDMAMYIDRASHPKKPEPVPGAVVLARRWGVSTTTSGRYLDEYREILAGLPRPLNVERGAGRSRVGRGYTSGIPTTEEPTQPTKYGNTSGIPRVGDGQPRARTIIPGSRLPAPGSKTSPPDAPPVEAPEPPPPPVDTGLDRVIAAYQAHHPTMWRKGPPKGLGVHERLAEHDADALIAVIEWAHTSPHPRAVYLREQGYVVGATIWRPGNFAGYLELARTPQVAPVRKATDAREEWGMTATDRAAAWMEAARRLDGEQ